MWYERRTCDSYACFVRSGYGLRKGWIYLLLIQPLIRFGARTHCFFNCILFFFQICSQKGLKQCVLMFLDRNARDMESSSSSSSIKVVYTCTCIQNAMEMFCGCIPPEYAKVVRHRYYCTHSTHTHNRSLNKLCGSPREPDSLRYPWVWHIYGLPEKGKNVQNTLCQTICLYIQQIYFCCCCCWNAMNVGVLAKG